MKRQLRFLYGACLLAGGLLTSAAPARAQSQTVDLIVNGGFETGDFSGWSVEAFPLDSQDIGTWVINDGSSAPSGLAEPFDPITGSYDAISFNYGPGLRVLSSAPLVIPRGVTGATLSWMDRIRNYNFQGFFDDPQLEFRVFIADANGDPIAEIYSTDPGDRLINGSPTARSFEVTALLQSLGGETVSLVFEQQDDLLDSNGFASLMNVYLDDVSLRVTFVPTPEPETEPVVVTMDVLPLSRTNVIDLEAALKATSVRRWLFDLLPVVVFSDESFDALSIDDTTLEFGDPELEGAVQPVAVCTGFLNRNRCRVLVVYFSLREMWEAGAINYDTTSLMLTGGTDEGTPFVGVKDVRVLAPKPPPKPRWRRR